MPRYNVRYYDINTCKPTCEMDIFGRDLMCVVNDVYKNLTIGTGFVITDENGVDVWRSHKSDWDTNHHTPFYEKHGCLFGPNGMIDTPRIDAAESQRIADILNNAFNYKRREDCPYRLKVRQSSNLDRGH